MPDDLATVIDAVATDPASAPFEREGSILYDAEGDQAAIYSAHPTDIRSYLRHEHFSLDWLVVKIDGLHHEATDLHETREIIDDADDDADVRVTGIHGTLPIGCITVKSKPRSSSNLSLVVND